MEKNNSHNFIRSSALLLACLLIAVCAQAQTIFLQHFGTKDGLPSNNCFYTLQDSKGYIWIATDAGVSRFDGKVFENFSVDDGLPDNQILQLKEDQNGRIWFLALNGQLSYFWNGKIYNEHNNQQLKLLRFNAIIVSFFQDSKGRIWLGTNKNVLVVWDGKSIMKYISADKKHQFINTVIHEDAAGKIWAFSNSDLRVLAGNNFKIVPHSSLPFSYKTTLNTPEKRMAFIDQSFRLNLKTGNRQRVLFKIDPKLMDNDPGYIFLDSNHDLWVSNSSGVFQIRPDGMTVRYLSGTWSSQVIKDAANNIWFTTGNGLYMLPQQNKRLYVMNRSNGLGSDVVKSITKDDNERIWLGMDYAGLNIVDTRSFNIEELTIPQRQDYNLIKQATFDRQSGAVYFASDYGLGRVKGDGTGHHRFDYLKETNNSMFVIKSFSLGHGPELALALSSGVVILPDRMKNFEFSSTYYKQMSNAFNNRAYSVFYDQSGKLWFSNINGLSEYSNGQLYGFFEKSPLLTRRINDIQQMDDGTVVLATDGYGLIYIKDKKIIKVITQRDGIADNICKRLFIKRDEVWVITNTGVNKIVLVDRKPVIESFEYTHALLSEGVNGMYIDDSRAYFATNNGLVFFSITTTKAENKPPDVFVSSIVSNKVKLALNEELHILDPFSNNITFNYSAIDFQNRDITYRYRLKPEAPWTETKSRRLEFSSLEPGAYAFELSAKSNNSSWSRPATIRFVTESHFWQTTWFFLLILILAGLILYKIAVTVTKAQKDKEQQQLLLRNKILMLEQRALQAMMNPHFVFNVMNSIQHYINTKDTTSANKVLTGFARLVRKNLEICTKSYITLEEELQYLELYLSLEKKRFGEKFNYTITVDRAIDREETFIPSMILQPYIENAIWHGIMPKEDGGNIDINIAYKDHDHLSIHIIDNGIGIDNSLREKKEGHQSKGMDLTRERINLLNQVSANPIQMRIVQNGVSGTFVSITIPLNQ